MSAYRCFGLNIESCLSMPGCPRSTGDIDVTISYGNVPDSLPDPVIRRTSSQASPGRFLLVMRNVAKYYVKDGQEVFIDPMPGVDEAEVRLFLLGSVWSALLIQRKVFPLHGSAINVDGESVIFSGLSGSGKSTIAALMQRRGYKIIADDLCAISLDDENIPHVMPGYPWLKLWHNTLKKIDEEKERLERIRSRLNKYYLPLNGSYYDKALPVSKVYIFHGRCFEKIGMASLKGGKAFSELKTHTYRYHQVKGLGMKASHFKQCSALAQSARIRSVQRPMDMLRIDELVDRLIEDFGS